MTISVGDKLPNATLSTIGAEGPEFVEFETLSKGRKIVLFGLPGAFTGTCDGAHLPSFMRSAEAFKAKGVEDIVCIAVNDPFVMHRWDDASGASGAGITMLADHSSALTKALGLEFDLPQLGFFNRCQRFALVAEDGKVTALNLEEETGVCSLTTGEELLAKL